MIPYDNTGVTVELRELIENGVNIWDFDYPSYYEGDKKSAFEKKVTDHYYFRQIGQETPGRWLHYFRSRMREIMPYYIQLYKFQEKIDEIDDPLESYNLTEEFKRDHTATESVNGTTSTSSESEHESEKTFGDNFERRFSDTPQSSVDNIDNYLTEATREKHDTTESGNENATVNASGTNEQTTNGSGEESYQLTRRGNIGVQPLGTEIENIRHSFINIDMMIINELKDLFLQVY